MKTKFIFFIVMQFIYCCSFSQYIGVKGRYTESRTVENLPEPPSRENRLILSFFSVSALGEYTPITLTNYDIWIYKQGFQYGSLMGGVLDSTGNNYPGYTMTAPKVVSYYNSIGLNYIDCDPNVATQYTVNGHELDCGFIQVSSWENNNESFTAPNICLPYYIWPNPYASTPGNVNFTWPVPPTAPYNWYSFACYNSTQQLVIRGVLPHSDSLLTILPITLANVKVSTNRTGSITISWSNLTESDISYYVVERSNDGISFHAIAQVLPKLNNSGQADYEFIDNGSNGENKIFYRIKVVENNGNYLYSTIVSINNSAIQTSTLSIYPNPVINGQITFQLTNAEKGLYSVSLVNAVGQERLVKKLQHGGGSLMQTLDLFNAPTGMYYFIIRSENMVLSKRIMIKN